MKPEKAVRRITTKAKEMERPGILRDVDPPQDRHLGKGRGRNFQAADDSLREKIARGADYLRYALPEVEGAHKAEIAKIRKLVCECGHRGDKHGHRYYFWSQRDTIYERLLGSCNVCRRDPDGCQQLRPVNALWIAPCSKHQVPDTKTKKPCTGCELGTWEVVDD